jgi:hypothetical protein
MLHLFNKVYLNFDDSIDCHTNRYVISEDKGNAMHEQLGTAYSGTLINYATNRNEMSGKYSDLTGFFEDVCTKQKSLNSKVIIYCDTQAFLEYSIIWLKTILPFADSDNIVKYLDLYLHNERITANTQLQPTHTLDLTKLNTGLGDVLGYVNVLPTLDLDRVKALNLDFSIELLLGEYFAGANSHEANLLTTYHMFLQRFYKEILTDVREDAALNLLNKSQQTALGYSANDVVINADNPFEGITELAAFADTDVFTAKPVANAGYVNTITIDNLTSEKQTALKTLISTLQTFQNIPNPDYSMSQFDKACGNSLSSSDFDTIINETVTNSPSLAYIPRFDVSNVNYSFLQYLFSLKKDNDSNTLGKFRLFANS